MKSYEALKRRAENLELEYNRALENFKIMIATETDIKSTWFERNAIDALVSMQHIKSTLSELNRILEIEEAMK